MLYQRYFIRMNQSNMTHLLGLLLAMCAILGVLQIVLAINTTRIKDELPLNYSNKNAIESTSPWPMETTQFFEEEEKEESGPENPPESIEITTTTTQKPILRIYNDISSRRKSDISLLDRIKNPNIRTTNYLNITKPRNNEDDNGGGYSEVTHFRERIQNSDINFRYKTMRNKTDNNKGKRSVRSVKIVRRRREARVADLTNNGTSRNETLTQQDDYHIGTGLTLSCCLLVYSGKFFL